MEEKNSYILGIIGGVLGGLIACIPWVLMYVYGNMILAALAIIIAIGVLKGYQLFHGKVNKALPVFIVIISLLIITVATFVFIPLLLMVKEGIPVTQENVEFIYAQEEFISALIGDYVISLLFTILGISGVVSNVRKQVKEGLTKDIKASIEQPAQAGPYIALKENIELFRQAFDKLEAKDKGRAVSKAEILNEVDHPNKEKIFKQLKMQQIIRKYRGNYYFSESFANSTFKRFIVLYIKIMGIVLLVAAAIVLLIFATTSNEESVKEEGSRYVEVNQDDVIRFSISSDWTELTSNRDIKENRRYYVPKSDRSGDSGIISVSYGTSKYKKEKYKDFRKALEKEIRKELKLDEIKSTAYIGSKKYPIIEIQLDFEEEDTKYTEKLYYILEDKQYALVDAIVYEDEDVDTLKLTKELVDSLVWKNEEDKKD